MCKHYTLEWIAHLLCINSAPGFPTVNSFCVHDACAMLQYKHMHHVHTELPKIKEPPQNWRRWKCSTKPVPR